MNGHSQPLTCPTCQQPITPEQRLHLPNKFGDSIADKIDATGDCWQWTGRLSSEGYGSAFVEDGKQRAAHRVIWETLVGPIENNLELDHLCRNRACVNPDHLEPVTHTENVRRGAGNQNARKTHCHRGHPFSGDNLRINRKGNRVCKACARINQRLHYHKKNPGASYYETGGERFPLDLQDVQAGNGGGRG